MWPRAAISSDSEAASFVCARLGGLRSNTWTDRGAMAYSLFPAAFENAAEKRAASLGCGHRRSISPGTGTDSTGVAVRSGHVGSNQPAPVRGRSQPAGVSARVPRCLTARASACTHTRAHQPSRPGSPTATAPARSDVTAPSPRPSPPRPPPTSGRRGPPQRTRRMATRPAYGDNAAGEWQRVNVALLQPRRVVAAGRHRPALQQPCAQLGHLSQHGDPSRVAHFASWPPWRRRRALAMGGTPHPTQAGNRARRRRTGAPRPPAMNSSARKTHHRPNPSPASPSSGV